MISRRQFLRRGVAAAAGVSLLDPPSAFALSTTADETVAASVLAVAANASFNQLLKRDWAAVAASADASQRLQRGGARAAQAFKRLRDAQPDFTQLSPSAANDRLVRMMLPSYPGKQSMSLQEVAAETDAFVAAGAKVKRFPPPSGTLQPVQSKPDAAAQARLQGLRPVSSSELETAAIATDAMFAATLIAGFTDEAHRAGLAPEF